MNALNLIDQLATHRPKRFMAPLPDADRTRICVLLDDIPYRFNVWVQDPGWWELEPVGKDRAKIVSPVKSMMDVMNYLRILPRFLVIALFRVRSSTWLVVPFNTADAEQRSWPNGEPRQLHLCRHRIQPFEVLEARRLGNELIYGLHSHNYGHSKDARLMRDSLLDSSPHLSISRDIPGMRQAWEILRQHIEEQKRQERLQSIAERKAGVEEQLRFHLDFMGAELSSWYESGEGYRVSWTHQGRSYDMDVARSGFIESAGVCLDSQDRRQNLSSIVEVMQEHRELGRAY